MSGWDSYSVRMLFLFLNNSMCSQALSQITTTLYADELSVSLCLHLQEICISVTKCSWQIWKCHICLWSRQRSYKLSHLLAYYLCPLQVLWSAYPSYFVLNVISKLMNAMERRKVFSSVVCQKARGCFFLPKEFLRVISTLYIKSRRKPSFFSLGRGWK